MELIDVDVIPEEKNYIEYDPEFEEEDDDYEEDFYNRDIQCYR